MILTVDIGNSNICFGVYEGKTPLFTARAKTDPLRSETEYAVLLSQIFALHRFDVTAIEFQLVCYACMAKAMEYDRREPMFLNQLLQCFCNRRTHYIAWK